MTEIEKARLYSQAKQKLNAINAILRGVEKRCEAKVGSKKAA